MSKVDLDSTNMKSSFILNINDTISALEKVLSIYDQMDIPYDFSKRQELSNIMSNFRSVKNRLERIKENVKESNADYNTLISILKDQARRMPNFTIKGRNTLI